MTKPSQQNNSLLLGNRWQHTITGTIYQIKQEVSEATKKSKSPKFDAELCEMVSDKSPAELGAIGRTSNISQTNFAQVWYLVEFGLLKQV